jgi:hypothetical protein
MNTMMIADKALPKKGTGAIFQDLPFFESVRFTGFGVIAK